MKNVNLVTIDRESRCEGRLLLGPNVIWANPCGYLGQLQLFFWGRDVGESARREASQERTTAPCTGGPGSPQPTKAAHVEGRSAASFEKGQRKSSCCCARQQCLPPSHPRALDRLPEVLWLVGSSSTFASANKWRKSEGLSGPPAAHFTRHHHQTRPSV